MSLHTIQAWTGEAVSLVEAAAQQVLGTADLSADLKTKIAEALGVLQNANQAFQTVQPGGTDWHAIVHDVLAALQQLFMLLQPLIPLLGALSPVGMTVQLALGALTALANAIPVQLPPVAQAPHMAVPVLMTPTPAPAPTG